MTRPQSLDHYTVTTGDLRRSPRSEVSDAAIAVCRELLTPGVHPLPVGDCQLRVLRRLPSELLAEVWRDALICTIWVCRNSKSLQRVLKETRSPAADIKTPACIARIEPGALAHQDTLDWLGDFERCLAWAWLESK